MIQAPLEIITKTINKKYDTYLLKDTGENKRQVVVQNIISDLGEDIVVVRLDFPLRGSTFATKDGMSRQACLHAIGNNLMIDYKIATIRHVPNVYDVNAIEIFANIGKYKDFSIGYVPREINTTLLKYFKDINLVDFKLVQTFISQINRPSYNKSLLLPTMRVVFKNNFKIKYPTRTRLSLINV